MAKEIYIYNNKKKIKIKDVIKRMRLETKENFEQAIEEYKNDKNTTLSSICKKYHIDNETFAKILEFRNIPIRNKVRKFFFDENIYDVINTEEKAYWLGFICADGCVEKYGVRIQLNRKDKEHLRKFAEIFNVLVKDINTFDKRYNKWRKLCEVRIHSIKI